MGKRKMMNMMTTGASTVIADDLSDGYTRIGDVARQFGVTLRALRFYEDKGLLSPRREGSTRLYARKDITRLKLILLGRKAGFSLREVKQIMDLYDPASGNGRQFRTLIEKSERQLVKLEKQRAVIDEAIGELKEAMAGWRAALAARQQPAAATA